LNSQVSFKIIEDGVSVDFCVFRLCFFMWKRCYSLFVYFLKNFEVIFLS
jgi:hypothetical protein